MGTLLCCHSFHWSETDIISIISTLNPLQEYIVAGGSTGSSTRSVLSLLPGASSWTTLASLLHNVYTGRASLVGGNVRVVGGSSSDDEVRINNLPG